MYTIYVQRQGIKILRETKQSSHIPPAGGPKVGVGVRFMAVLLLLFFWLIQLINSYQNTLNPKCIYRCLYQNSYRKKTTHVSQFYKSNISIYVRYMCCLQKLILLHRIILINQFLQKKERKSVHLVCAPHSRLLLIIVMCCVFHFFTT